MKTDVDLKRDVESELLWEPSVDERRIGVAVVDGIVTLTGEVPLYSEKWSAERATERVIGVKGIANEIVVKSGLTRTDTDIAAAAVTALDANIAVPDTVKVKVSNGWLTLLGEVTWDFQRRAAERTVRGLSGVRGVSNQIVLKPKVQPENIKEKIEETFKRSAVYDAKNVTVHVSGSEVTLRGTVRSWIERNEAEKAAYAAPGVTVVHNYITVRAA